MKWLNGSEIRSVLTVCFVVFVIMAGSAQLADADDFEGMRPIADAGTPRYVDTDPVSLDGTGSYDPDSSGPLSYSWRQIAGPPTTIKDANTATPIVNGFVQTNEIQECEFELVVSDGELTSQPDTVKVIIVPDLGDSTWKLENPPFDPDKPTIIYFDGGDCLTGGGTWDRPSWLAKANLISFYGLEGPGNIPPNYVPDSAARPPTYYRCGDIIIAYLSSVAPDYKQPIQTMGFSTGGQPAVDVGIRLNATYRDARYAVNRVTLEDASMSCRSYENYSDSIAAFIASSVDGEQCWLDNYVSQQADFYPNVLNVGFEQVDHILALWWYDSSWTNVELNKFNNGVVAGAYWSVLGPGKNLQLASTPDEQTYKFIWYGDAYSGYMDFYDESNHPGRLPEPVTLIGPPNGAFVDANGVVLSCEVSENAVGYQLLFGADPYRVMDYTIVSDTPEPPTEVITTFPYEQTWWTVKVYDAFGSTIYADPVCIYPQEVEIPEPGLIAHWKMDETEGDIAYDSAGDNDAIVHGAVWTEGRINGALQFDGFSDYVDCGDSEQLGPEQVTFSMWLKPEHMGGIRYIVARSKKNSDDIDYAIKRLFTGEVEFSVGQLGSEPLSVQSQANIPLNEWSHVAVCLDGSKASIYINGQRDSSSNYAERVPRGDYWLVVGSLRASTRFYNGLIDDVRIYDQALSEEESRR